MGYEFRRNVVTKDCRTFTVSTPSDAGYDADDLSEYERGILRRVAQRHRDLRDKLEGKLPEELSSPEEKKMLRGFVERRKQNKPE